MTPPATLQALGEQQPLDNTMGSMVIGVIFSAVLFGITLVQTFYYYRHYPKDIALLKYMVGGIALLDTAHLIMITHTVYHYLVTSYYNHAELNVMTWSVLVEALPTAVTGSAVQCYYAYRIWLLSHGNKTLVATILLLVLACTGCGTAWLIMALQRKTYTRLLEVTALTITINALSAVVDVLIAGVSVYYLHTSRTGFKRSDTLITKLTLFVVNTGLLTSLCAVGALICLLVSPNSLLYASFYFCIGRFYVNSLLASLNARTQLRRGDPASENTINLSNQVLSHSRRNPQDFVEFDPSGRTKELAIRIEATTKREYDEGHTTRGAVSDSDDNDMELDVRPGAV